MKKLVVNYDASGFMYLVYNHLLTVRNHIANSGHHLDDNETIAEMDTVLNLLDIVIEGRYEKEVLAEFEKKYGKHSFKFVKLEGGKYKDCSTMLFTWGGEENSKASQLYHKAQNKAMTQQRKALQKVMNLISCQYEGWWD